MALYSRDAVTVSAAVATRSRADCSSMEGHTSLSTALVKSSKYHIMADKGYVDDSELGNTPVSSLCMP